MLRWVDVGGVRQRRLRAQSVHFSHVQYGGRYLVRCGQIQNPDHGAYYISKFNERKNGNLQLL